LKNLLTNAKGLLPQADKVSGGGEYLARIKDISVKFRNNVSIYAYKGAIKCLSLLTQTLRL